MHINLPPLIAALVLPVVLMAQQCPTIEVQKLPQVDSTLHNISCVDGTLYLVSGNMLQTATTRYGTVVAVEGDTSYWTYSPYINYVTRGGIGGNVYFTVAGRHNQSKLYCIEPRPGKKPKVSRIRLGGLDIHHPTFTADGKIMVFAAEKSNGYGGSDLWYSIHSDDGKWSKPHNLGPKINNYAHQTKPCLWGNYLIFATSDTANGSNQLTSTLLIETSYDTSNNPIIHIGENKCYSLPYPFNAESNDFEIAVDTINDRIYIVSDRNGSSCLCVYENQIPITVLSGIVTNSSGIPITGTNIELYNGENLVCRTSSDNDGYYQFILTQNQNYTLWVSKNDHFGNTVNLHTFRNDHQHIIPTIEQNIELDQLNLNNTFYIDELFGPDADIELSENGIYKLQRIVRFLYENPHIAMEATLHSAITNNTQFNFMLTQKRIESLLAYLHQQIPNNTISIENGCNTADGGIQEAYNSQLVVRIYDKYK
ncbi:MAG: carboxypeptidase regulatory-like domain-containing protein [Bacteroidales bacterium]|nr:carboxypeptidase regulatory-like domain-containing protein [Candidatus Colimorpha onthohippi]